MFTAPCTRPSGPRISSPCNGMIKLDNNVSTAARSLSASMAAHARAPSKPLPNASNAVPQILDNFSFFLSASPARSPSCRKFHELRRFTRQLPQNNARHGRQAVTVYVNTGNGLFVIPCNVIFEVFFGSFCLLVRWRPFEPFLGFLRKLSRFSTPGLSLPRLFLAPANKS